MGENNRNFLIPIYISVALSVGVLIGDFMSRGLGKNKLQNLKNANKLYEVLNILDQNYVDDINKDSLFLSTINDMLHKLDPHSNYIPSEEVLRMRESIEGKFGGIGVRFFILRDTICITNVIENTPASNAGLMSGDKITHVNSERVAGVSISNEDVMKRLKGQENTEVSLTVSRNKKKLDFKFNRGSIPLQTVNSSYMFDDSTGYIRIDQFSIPTYDEFMVSAKVLLDSKMKRLVLDLRNNGGGVMESAVKIVDEFLPEGQLIVSARGKNFKSQNIYSTGSALLKNIPLVILMNAYSASASEIVAGALQDNDRGVIVGNTSFGKGLIQEDRKMSDGSRLRVTVARYYTPSGRCIQRPYEGKSYEDYLLERRSQKTYGKESSNNTFPDSLKFETIYKKRPVFGGGGIYPDVIIELDTVPDSLQFSAFFLNARLIGAFTAFSFDFLQKNHEKWRNFDEFKSDPTIINFNCDLFYSYCLDQYGLPFIERETAFNRETIKTWVKAELARQIWGDRGYFKIINKDDPFITKGLSSFGFLER